MKAVTRIHLIMCLTIVTLTLTNAMPISSSIAEKKAKHLFNRKVLDVFDQADQFFQANWEADSARLIELTSYMRQNEHFTGNFDCKCKNNQYLGRYKGDQLSETRKNLIRQMLKLHDADVQVCVLEFRDGTPAMSYFGGQVFIDWKMSQKLTDEEFIALLAHEMGHGYGYRVIQRDQEEEIFADYVAAWTLRSLGLDTKAAVTLFNRLPGSKGGTTHPPHKTRQARLAKLIEGWELSATVSATSH